MEILKKIPKDFSALLGEAKKLSPVEWFFVLIATFGVLWAIWKLAQILIVPALLLVGIWAAYRAYQAHSRKR